MEIYTLEDVDKFFDKFEDPSHELELIRRTADKLYDRRPVPPCNQSELERMWELRDYFFKKLVMKSYRLGKEHAYADSISTIRDR